MIDPLSRPFRIFVPGFYTWGNKGDAALLLSFASWLEMEFKTTSLAITSFTPERDESHFDYPVLDMVIRPHARIHRRMNAVASRIPALRGLLTLGRVTYTQAIVWYLAAWAPLFRRYPRFVEHLVPLHVRLVARAIIESDTVISVPGGYLNALHRTDDLWLFHVPTFRLAYSLGKPPVLGPCSIGPFAWPYRSFAHGLLQRTQRILVREDKSLEILRQLGIPDSKISRTPDMAFGQKRAANTAAGDAATAQLMREAGDREIIGISVREHSFPGRANRARAQGEYLQHVAKAVGELSARENAAIVIVPQTLEDIPTGRALASLFQERFPTVPCTTLENDLSPSDLMNLYGRLRLLVGTRMHANILAMCAGTAVAAIAYELKTFGILERMGLAAWGIDIDQLSDDRLGMLVRRQWKGATEFGTLAFQCASTQREALSSLAATLAPKTEAAKPRYQAPR